MVLPTTLAPRSTRLRCSSTKSRVKARSMTSRSIFLGQTQSKSAMGLKRPMRERSSRLSRLRLAPSVSSRRTISSTTWRGEKRPLLARARKSSLPSAKAMRPIWVSWSLRSGVFVVVGAGKLIVDLRLMRPDHEVGQVGTAREVDGERRPGLGRASAPLQQVGDGGDTRRLSLEGLDQGGPEGLRPVVVEQAQELYGGRASVLTLGEGRLQEGLSLGHGGGEAAGRCRASGSALVLEKGLLVADLVDVLISVVAASVSDDLGLAIQDAHRDRGGHKRELPPHREGRNRVVVEVEGDPDPLELPHRTHQLGREGMQGQRQQPRLLFREDLRHRPLRVVRPGPLVRHLVAPRPSSPVEVLERGEGCSFEEGLPHVTDGSLHLALLVALTRGTRTRLEVVVRAQLDEARVEVNGAALPLQHGRLEVVVEDHARHAGEEVEGGHVAAEEVLLALVEEKLEEEGPGEGERHHETRQSALGAPDGHLSEVGPVHLRLLTGQTDQAQERLFARRTEPRHHAAQALNGAHVAALADHHQESRRPQAWVPLQRLAQEGQVGIEAAGAKSLRPVQRIGLHRRADGVAVHAKLRGDGADLPVLGEVQAADGGDLLRIEHARLPREWIDQRPGATADATKDLAPARIGRGPDRRQQGRQDGRRIATLIRHAERRGQAPAVLPLTIAVVESPLRANLVPTIRRSSLLPPRFVPTPLRAVPLSAIAAPAHVEHRPASLAATQSLSERDLLAASHRPCRAGLDNGPPAWEARSLFGAASLTGGHTKPRSPLLTTTGVSFLRLPAESLDRHAGRAFGADDDEGILRQDENRTSRRAPTLSPCKGVTTRLYALKESSPRVVLAGQAWSARAV